jgi:hypothetical protein
VSAGDAHLVAVRILDGRHRDGGLRGLDRARSRRSGLCVVTAVDGELTTKLADVDDEPRNVDILSAPVDEDSSVTANDDVPDRLLDEDPSLPSGEEPITAFEDDWLAVVSARGLDRSDVEVFCDADPNGSLRPTMSLRSFAAIRSWLIHRSPSRCPRKRSSMTSSIPTMRTRRTPVLPTRHQSRCRRPRRRPRLSPVLQQSDIP